MDRKRLLSFIALAEELHFDRAAARRNITQPAISQQLQHLETQLGVQLIARSKRRVSLTRVGEMFLGEARRIVAQMDDAMHLARRMDDGEIGQLTVGVTAPALYVIFPEIVRRFAETLPNVRLMPRELTTAEQEDALRSGEIQVGLLHPPLVDDSLACRDIAQVPFDVVMSDRHPLLARPELTLADFAGERFILFPRRIGPRLYDQILALCVAAGFSPEIIIEAHPAQSIVALAACGLGIGFIAAEVQHFRRPLAAYRRLSGPAPSLTLGVAHLPAERSPLIAAFEQAAADVADMVR